MKTGDDYIEQEVPLLDRVIFPQVAAAAYKAVEDLVSETPFLQCPPAVLARGHLNAWAMDFGFSQLIESGRWKVEGYDWAWFNRPTGKYLRIFTKKSIMTISQLPDTSHQPRQADFRENDGYDPQAKLALFPDEKDLTSIKRPHLLLVHGYHKLDFIHVAMPNPNKQPVWLGLSKNILEEMHEIDTLLMPTEGPAVAPTITIKEHLKKEIRDNHG